MKLNDIWGYGQLFGFSAIDGVNSRSDDFVAVTATEKIKLQFELEKRICLYFPVPEAVFDFVTSDVIYSEKNGFLLAYESADVLIGYSPVLPVFSGEDELRESKTGDISVYDDGINFIAAAIEKSGDSFFFRIARARSAKKAAEKAGRAPSAAEAVALMKKRLAYYEKLPPCKDEKYEKLYYKALSVQKVNVYSPEGNIPVTWTTPDRVPHKNMWLWDSVFHALALACYDGKLAESAIKAVLSQAREDGFIPHMASPDSASEITQPQVLAFGAWEVYRKTGDKQFLRDCAPVIEKFLLWTAENRDENGNGLLEWHTDRSNARCRCDESGMDNSPRFDFDSSLDAVDFSTFLCNDCKYLSYIYKELGDFKKFAAWAQKAVSLSQKINELTWDEQTGAYYDRLTDGSLTKVLTQASFLPLFAGICSSEDAKRLVATLTDENLLWTPFPLSSVAKTHPSYSTDMWRGGAWLNYNYLIARGLTDYGYCDVAERLRNKTLQAVNEWYEKTGSIFEFYDPENKTSPFECERKGPPVSPPDWRKHMHSISDYNWSACFTMLFIQREYYSDKK